MPSNYRGKSSKKPVRRKPPGSSPSPDKPAVPAVTGRTDDPINNKEWRSLVRWTLRTQGTTCHLCGHGGSDSADHLVPRSEDPEKTYDASNLKPVHHKPCPACGLRCNMLRSNMSVEGAKRKIARLQGLSDDTPAAEDGREWLQDSSFRVMGRRVP